MKKSFNLTEEVAKCLRKSPKADDYQVWMTICKKAEPKFGELGVKEVVQLIKAGKIPSVVSVYKTMYKQGYRKGR